MSDPNRPSTPPGWYSDGQGGQRWWDGGKWTEHTQPPPGAGAPPARPTPPAPAAGGNGPADLPTQVAPNRAADYGAPQGAQPGQPGPVGAGAPPPIYGQHPFVPGGTGSGGSGGRGKLLAIVGGAFVAVLVVMIGLIVLVTVVLGGGPEDVAEDYLDASVDADFERVCELVTEKDRDEAFEELDVDDCSDVEDAVRDDEAFNDQDLEDYLEDFDTEYEIGEVTEDGDTAEVKFTSTTEYTGDDEDIAEFYEDAEENKGTIYLREEDGDWKVDAEKSDSAGLF